MVQGNKAQSLFTACEKGHLSDIRQFLSEQKLINTRRPGDGMTPLMIAVYNGHLDCVTYLINRGADVTLQDASGRTALDYARDTAMVDLLRGVGLTAVKSLDEQLRDAVKRGDVAAVRNLLARGAKVSAVDSDSRTALVLAAANGDTVAAKMLESGTLNINALDPNGNTLLMRNVTNLEIVFAAIQAGADINIQNENGDTALMMAAGQTGTDVVRALIDAGADVNIQNRRGETALFGAAVNGSVANVETLINAGADLEIADVDGNTAVMAATREGQIETTVVLIENNADICHQNNDGQAVAHICAETLTGDDVTRFYEAFNAREQSQIDTAQTLQNNRGETATHITIARDKINAFSLGLQGMSGNGLVRLFALSNNNEQTVSDMSVNRAVDGDGRYLNVSYDICVAKGEPALTAMVNATTDSFCQLDKHQQDKVEQVINPELSARIHVCEQVRTVISREMPAGSQLKQLMDGPLAEQVKLMQEGKLPVDYQTALLQCFASCDDGIRTLVEAMNLPPIQDAGAQKILADLKKQLDTAVEADMQDETCRQVMEQMPEGMFESWKRQYREFQKETNEAYQQTNTALAITTVAENRYVKGVTTFVAETADSVAQNKYVKSVTTFVATTANNVDEGAKNGVKKAISKLPESWQKGATNFAGSVYHGAKAAPGEIVGGAKTAIQYGTVQMEKGATWFRDTVVDLWPFGGSDEKKESKTQQAQKTRSEPKSRQSTAEQSGSLRTTLRFAAENGTQPVNNENTTGATQDAQPRAGQRITEDVAIISQNTGTGKELPR